MRKEIFFANLTVLHQGNKVILKKVVYKETDGFYDNQRVLSKYGMKNKMKVLHVDVICSLGFENIDSNFTEIKKSDEERNTTTGAYD